MKCCNSSSSSHVDDMPIGDGAADRDRSRFAVEAAAEAAADTGLPSPAASGTK